MPGCLADTYFIPLSDVVWRTKLLIAERLVSKLPITKRDPFVIAQSLPDISEFIRLVCDEFNWPDAVTLTRAISALVKVGLDEETSGEVASEVFKLVAFMIGDTLPHQNFQTGGTLRVDVMGDGVVDLCVTISRVSRSGND